MAKLEEQLKKLLSNMTDEIGRLGDELSINENDFIRGRISQIMINAAAIKTIVDHSNPKEMSEERRNELKELYPDTLTIAECSRKMLIDILTAQGVKNGD